MRKIKGFTLIELIVFIGLFMIVGVAIVSILFVALRSSKKSDLLVVIKQNGNSALSQMVRQIRYAKSLDTPSNCPAFPGISGDITITSSTDNAQTTFSCTAGSPATIASNGASLVDTSAVSVTACSLSCSKQNANSSPIVNIKFTLNSANSSGLVESTNSVPFQTSVEMRNF